MKTILCYGDSNTWGYDPVMEGRHRYEDRWTTILQETLGGTYLVIPEGLCGRTTVWDDPIEGDKNGRTHLTPCLESHKPLDLVIIMLGTNDLKARFSLPASDIAAGVGVLTDIVHTSGCGPRCAAPSVLILIPPATRGSIRDNETFGDCRAISQELPRTFTAMAEQRGVRCLDIGKSVRLSGIDGIHFERSQLGPLGRLVAQEVRRIMGIPDS